jgi:carboxyl-terminal processing protease
MKSILRLSVLLLASLLLSRGAFALDETGIANRAKRLVDFFEKNHLQPRTLDAQFGQDLNLLLVDYLDESKLFFYKSDFQELSFSADSLFAEINESRINHLLLLEKILHKRIEEVRLITTELLDKGTYALTIEGSLNKATDFSSDKGEFELRWRKTIAKLIQDELLGSLKDDETLKSIDLTARCTEAIESVRSMLNDQFDYLLATDEYFEMTYINCIAGCYDPHSNYFNAHIKEEFKEELSSQRELFGITYQKSSDGSIKITSIMPGSPAWYSDGIASGDELLKLTSSDGNFIDVTKASPAEVSSFFSMLETDSLVLTLRSNGEKSEVNLVKSVVYSDEDIIKSALLTGDKKIGYISLPDFYTDWTDTSSLGCANDVAKSLLRLQKDGIDGMILDLRNNGGGSIKEAIDLAGIFIDYGPIILEVDNTQSIYTYKDFNRGSIYRGPLIILINSSSASASEIVSAALQDYNRALIVGQQSYGKATGQMMIALDPTINPRFQGFIPENPEWGYAKITEIGLFRVTKETAQLVGVTPDILLDDFDYSEAHYEKDYAHALKLGPIEKKIYFTPTTKLPIAAIQSDYLAQKGSHIGALTSLIDSIGMIMENGDQQLSLTKSDALVRELKQMLERYTSLNAAIPFSYAPSSFQFKEEVLKMSPFLQKYNDRFIERLSGDVELNEAYKIMLGLIKALE